MFTEIQNTHTVAHLCLTVMLIFNNFSKQLTDTNNTSMYCILYTIIVHLKIPYLDIEERYWKCLKIDMDDPHPLSSTKTHTFATSFVSNTE